MEYTNPHPKTSTEHWKEEAERRNIELLPTDDKLAEIKAKVLEFDKLNPDFFGVQTPVNPVQETKAETPVENKIKIIVQAGVRFGNDRTEEPTEIEILEKDWDKYSHVAEKLAE